MFQRIYVTIILFCCSFIVVKAASYDIQLSVSSIQKTSCYADGKIYVKLGGADVSVLVPTDQISINVIRNGVSYKQHDLTIADMNAQSIFVLEGYADNTYTIDYTLWVGNNTEIKGSIATFTVEANPYSSPSIAQSLGNNQNLLGTRPSLSCISTGRIQLEISGGKLPYTVEIYKNGSLLRTETYNSPMNSGTDPLSETYKDYYNIENLGVGSYTFFLEDSCGSRELLPETILVPEVDFSCVTNFANYVSYSNGIILFSLSNGFFKNVKYDNYSSQWLEYRFALEGEPLGAWKTFSNTAYTTVDSLGAVKGKKYKFEVRVKDCPTSYPVCEAEVLIPDQGTSDPSTPCVEKYIPSVILIPVSGSGGSDFCPCEGGTPSPVVYDKWQVKTSFSVCAPYTFPLTYQWENMDYPQYSYINNRINLPALSFFSAQYPLSDDMYGSRVHIELTDAANLVFLDTIINIPPKPADPAPVLPIPLQWKLSESVSAGSACGGTSGGGLSLEVNCAEIPDGAEIKLTQTPDGYQFTASYDYASRQWDFSPSTFSDFTITQSVYNPDTCVSSIDIDFNSLFHYGTYQFDIKWLNLDATDTTTTLTKTIVEDFERLGVSEELSFTTKKTCQGTVYYPHAQVVSWTSGDEANTSPELTKFRVIEGNITGYEINGGVSTIGVCNSDSLLITKAGMYVVQSFYNPDGGDAPVEGIKECTVSLDTINYQKQSVTFDDYYGYLCADTRESSVRGGVTVIAKEGSGVPPYQYDLYSGSDDSGTLLESNNVGVFQDLNVSSPKFYVRVTDQCSSSFGVEIPLSPIVISDVIFGDRSVCLGSTAYLQGKMLGATNLVSYQWTGSNGFSSDVRQMISPAIYDSETFYLTISGLGCSIFDSITVEPVTEIKLYYEDLICQGTNYDGGEEYKQTISTASLPEGVYKFSSGPFPAVKGGCDSTANLTLRIITENSVIEDTMVICNNQLPFFWQDSLFTEGTQSGVYYKPMTINACNFKRALRLTVGQPVDLQFDRVICEGDTIVFNGKTYDATGSYTDHFIAQTTCDSLETLHLRVISPDETVLYDSIFQEESYDKNGFSFPVQYDMGEKYSSVMLKNQYGCDSTVSLYLEVLSPLVKIPEVFTPNGDNKNSFFVIKNIDRYPDNQILIFNRWGNKVYEGKPYMNEWDGKNYFGPKIGGDVLPVGTYYYILDLGDGSDVIKGFIYLNK